MKRIKGNLLIIIIMLLILTINLVSTVYAEPLTRIDGSVRVENVGGNKSYKSSRLKLQKLNYINGTSEINSVDFQDGKAVAVFAEKTNLENDLNNDFKHKKTNLENDLNNDFKHEKTNLENDFNNDFKHEKTSLSKEINLVEDSIEPLNDKISSSNRVEDVSTVTTVPNKMLIDTGSKVLGSIGYEDFYLIANKITTEVGPAYCLEVEKEYPSGELFEFEGTPEKNIIGMMAAGYPNKSAEELGAVSDDAAYFATQMAIWCVTEGYVPKNFKSSDKNMLQIIKNIYEEGMQYNGEDVGHIAMEYYYSDGIQRIVAYVLNREEVIPPSEEVPVKPGETKDSSGDFEEWPDTSDDEEIIETPSEDESEKVVVPGLG